ncbi:MAG: universal stress protein [Flavobacteriales bacterium]|nr:universal stress protein [Flavobacteriales bacterium]
MKTIILPTDGSKHAERAMRYALHLFTGQSVRFIIFQSVDISAYGADLPVVNVIGTEETEDILKRNTDAMRKEFSHEPFDFVIKAALGGLAPCLDELAEDTNASLIVMGTKGASGLLGSVIGSNAADVIANASCPVIAVPEDAELKRPQRILFATDNKGLSTPDIAAPMLEIARDCKATIQLVHVLDEGHTIALDEAIAGLRMEHLLNGIPHDYLFLANSDKATAIESHANENGIDMVVTVPRRNNFFDAIFHRSVTRKLALHTKVPMLVMHDLG